MCTCVCVCVPLQVCEYVLFPSVVQDSTNAHFLVGRECTVCSCQPESAGARGPAGWTKTLCVHQECGDLTMVFLCWFGLCWAKEGADWGLELCAGTSGLQGHVVLHVPLFFFFASVSGGSASIAVRLNQGLAWKWGSQSSQSREAQHRRIRALGCRDLTSA